MPLTDLLDVAYTVCRMLDSASSALVDPSLMANENVLGFSWCSANNDDFTLLLSDLTRVWDGSLSYRDVLDQAARQSTPIDPAESRGQFRALTTRLLQSLKEGSNILIACEGSQQRSFYIRTSIKLPSPLKLLEWTFKLIERDPPAFAHLITLPCLQEAYHLMAEVQSLLETIKEKDHVIAKLLDKIENYSTDLSLIFPGITGLKSRKQRVGVAEASKHIPALSPFDRSKWRENLAADQNLASLDNSNFSDVFPLIENSVQKSLLLHNWTSELPSETSLNSAANYDYEYPERGHDQSQINSVEPKTVTSTDSDVEFEEVRTPRKQENDMLESSHHPAASSSASDSDEVKKPLKPTETHKTTVLGKKTPISKPRKSDSSSLLQNPRPPSPRLPGFGYASESESDSDLESKPTSLQVSQTTTKSKRKLGRLGGKTKSQPSQSLLLSEGDHRTSPNPSAPSRKLGMLGGKNKLSASSTPNRSPAPNKHSTVHAPSDLENSKKADDPEATPSPLPSQHPRSYAPSQRSTIVANPSVPTSSSPGETIETPEERANRIRSELKHNLESTSNTNTRKKRRF